MGSGGGGSKETVKLALIQPNIDQKDKMDPALVVPTFDLQEKMSYQAAREKPEIMVWPETSVFSYLLRDAVLFPRLQQLARKTRAWLLIGTPYSDEAGRVYNSIVSLSPEGKVFSRYDKQHLVPFGEYLPFRQVLYPFLKKVGYYDQAFDFPPAALPVWAGKRKISPAVCFESTFPHLIRRMTSRDSAFILTVTNDAWFGDSSAPYFHLNTGIFRAVENRKFFIQVGNSGITAVIDPDGRILARTRLNQRGILAFKIPLS
jgi:apolipoprotein N-acyltransferase